MIGEIRLFAGNFSPRSWAYCSGQLLNVNQNAALYSLLGNTFGGSGSTTFALPDLRGRVAVGTGQGAGLSTNIARGTVGGVQTNALTVANMPAHTHALANASIPVSGSVALQMKVNNTVGDLTDPLNNYIGFESSGAEIYNSASSGTDQLNASAISVNTSGLTATLPAIMLSNTGSGGPFTNLQPSLGLSYIICINGYYPTRN